MVESKGNKEEMQKLLYAVLDECGLDMVQRLRALKAMAYEHFIGKDYLKHFDNAFHAVRERGYSFHTTISVDFQNFDFVDPVQLFLERKPSIQSIPQEDVPYGSWFTWKISANQAENILTIEREITDPTKTEPCHFGKILTCRALSDSTVEKISTNTECELLGLFRKTSLEALTQLSDFSKLSPEPQIKQFGTSSDYEDCLKSFWRSDIYPNKK